MISESPIERLPSDSRRLKVLHVYSGNLYGGVEAFLRTMARHRASTPSMKTDFALCFDRRIARELRDAGATVHLLGAVRVRTPRSIAAARRAFATVLEAGGYGVVVCHSAWPHAIFAPVVRAHRIPLAYFMHDAPNGGGWIDRWANLSPPDTVLCNSAFTANSGRWFFRSVPRRVARLPLAHDEYGPKPGARAELRAALGVPPGAVVILQTSRMQAWKGQRLLIDALARLERDSPWVCWIAGGAQRPAEVEYERDLRAAAERQGLAGRVQFLGQRDDVPALMRAADVYCQPNLAPEPFGLALVEALAAGLPVVTSRMGGAVEIVDATCGRLVAPDAESVASALTELIADAPIRASLSAAGPSRARDLCGAEARVRDLAATLTSLDPPRAPFAAEARAALSEGRSDHAIHAVVASSLRERGARFDVLVDLGCGRGDCSRSLAGMYRAYVGCDAVRYEGFPTDSSQFRQVDLNRVPYPLDDASASLVISVETIEHVENPRALVREMVRVVRPGGWVVVTTPNQLSFAAKLHLLVKNQFQAFQEAPGLYPAHITALLEEDLRRIARECGLVDVAVRYTDRGRVPFTNLHWPSRAGARGRWFSDNVVVIGRRP